MIADSDNFEYPQSLRVSVVGPETKGEAAACRFLSLSPINSDLYAPLPCPSPHNMASHPDEYLNVHRGSLAALGRKFSQMDDPTGKTPEGRLRAMRLCLAGRFNDGDEEKRIVIADISPQREFRCERIIEGLLGVTKTLPFIVPWTVLPYSPRKIEDEELCPWIYRKLTVDFQLEVCHGGHQ